MATDYPDLTRARLRQVLEHLQAAVYSERAPLSVAAREVRGEPIPYAEAVAGEFRPVAPGTRWGPPWSTTWFHLTGSVPESWAGRPAGVLLDLGFGSAQTGFTCEALAWRGGRPWRGVDPNHRWLPLPAGPVDLHLEAAANVRAALFGAAPAESMLRLRESPEPAFTLVQAELAVRDESVRALYLDFKVLLELAGALPAGEPRAAELLAALNRAANALSLEDVAGTAAAARAELADVMARRPGDAAHRVIAVGHAHLDTAWLWPLREAVRKCARTFSTVLELMDEHPDFKFAASQPAHYAWMRDHYPDLYARIKERVAEGRWEPVGAMWVEADCNLPSGEALVRQLVHGKRFFRDELGVESEEVWLPDVFGYPASLPQLIAGAGCRRFLTQKLSWNQFNRIPHDTFWWEGIDGSRVLTHFPPTDTYNGLFEVGPLLAGVRRFRDQGRSDVSLYLFGHGDGGGGPETDHLEVARRLAALEGAPPLRLGTAGEFFAAVEAQGHRLATWTGELYFELHRGTYTTQARTKRLNRRAEQALREAELWSAVAGAGYPRAELDRTWKLLLVSQFHDILPGTGVDWVAAEAERDLAEAVAAATGLTERAAGALLDDEGPHCALLNTNGHARREVMAVAGELRRVEVPACGFAVLEAAPRPAGAGVTASERHLENELLRVEWDGAGRLTRLFDKEADREVLPPGGRANLLQLHPDHPLLWDAWDLDAYHEEVFEELDGVERIEVEREGGLRGAVRVSRRFGASSLVQRLELDAGSRLLRFHTEVDWRERHRVLKAAFPVAVRSARATFEIQFGHVERPTHRNTSWDVARFESAAQRWIDLGEAGYGVALLNDGKYGHSVQGSTLRVTLLRAPTKPDPEADQGRHEFTYALLPHPGDFRTAGVIQAAADLNSPLRPARTRLLPGTSTSYVSVDTPQVAVEAVKRADDSGALVVRLYEAWGGTCRARVRLGLPVRRAALADLLERELEEVPVEEGCVDLRFDPFKIVTLKLES